MRQLQLIARAYHRVLKLSRTIADLGGSEAIAHAHLAEVCSIGRSWSWCKEFPQESV